MLAVPERMRYFLHRDAAARRLSERPLSQEGEDRLESLRPTTIKPLAFTLDGRSTGELDAVAFTVRAGTHIWHRARQGMVTPNVSSAPAVPKMASSEQ